MDVKNIFQNEHGEGEGRNYLFLGVPGSGKTMLMSALLGQRSSIVSMGTVTDLKLPSNKGSKQ